MHTVTEGEFSSIKQWTSVNERQTETEQTLICTTEEWGHPTRQSLVLIPSHRNHLLHLKLYEGG